MSRGIPLAEDWLSTPHLPRLFVVRVDPAVQDPPVAVQVAHVDQECAAGGTHEITENGWVSFLEEDDADYTYGLEGCSASVDGCSSTADG